MPQEVLLPRYFSLFSKRNNRVCLTLSLHIKTQRQGGKTGGGAELPDTLPWWHLQTLPSPSSAANSADTPSARCRLTSADKLSNSSTTRPPSLKKHIRIISLAARQRHSTPALSRRQSTERRRRGGKERRETGVWCPPVPEEAACQLGKARWKQSHMMAAERRRSWAGCWYQVKQTPAAPAAAAAVAAPPAKGRRQSESPHQQQPVVAHPMDELQQKE